MLITHAPGAKFTSALFTSAGGWSDRTWCNTTSGTFTTAVSPQAADCASFSDSYTVTNVGQLLTTSNALITQSQLQVQASGDLLVQGLSCGALAYCWPAACCVLVASSTSPEGRLINASASAALACKPWARCRCVRAPALPAGSS